MNGVRKVPSASIIVLTYNSEEDIDECLGSVLSQEYQRFRLTVVDNNSRDDTVHLIRNNFPGVRVIMNEKNLGFAEGNNVGIRECEEEYVILLNPDTIVEERWLSELVRIMEENTDAAAAMSKILLYDRRDLINSSGNELSFTGFGWAGDYRERDRPEDGQKEVPYPSGTSMILRRSALEEVGLFDDYLFLYQEDADLGIRLRIAGYNILYCPSSVVYHKYENTLRNQKLYYLERNRHVLLLKNFEKMTLLLLLPALLLAEMGVLLHSFRHKWLIEKLRAYVDILGNLDSIKSKRREIQDGRKIGDRELFGHLRGGIYYGDVLSPLVTNIVNPFFEKYFEILKGFTSNSRKPKGI